MKCWNHHGQHSSVKDPHYGVSDALSGIYITEVLAGSDLHDKIPKCQDNFCGKGGEKHDSPPLQANQGRVQKNTA